MRDCGRNSFVVDRQWTAPPIQFLGKLCMRIIPSVAGSQATVRLGCRLRSVSPIRRMRRSQPYKFGVASRSLPSPPKSRHRSRSLLRSWSRRRAAAARPSISAPMSQMICGASAARSCRRRPAPARHRRACAGGCPWARPAQKIEPQLLWTALWSRQLRSE